MSLINQMLRDLEQRTEGPVLEQEKVLHGLGSTAQQDVIETNSRSAGPIWVLTGLLFLLSIYLILDRYQWLDKDAETLATVLEEPAAVISTEQANLTTEKSEPEPQPELAESLPAWQAPASELQYEMLSQSEPELEVPAEAKQLPPDNLEQKLADKVQQTEQPEALIDDLGERLNLGPIKIDSSLDRETELAAVLVGDETDTMHWDALKQAPPVGESRQTLKDTDKTAEENSSEKVSVSRVARQEKIISPDKTTVQPARLNASEEKQFKPAAGEQTGQFSKETTSRSKRELAIEHYQKALEQIRRQKNNQAIDSLRLALMNDAGLTQARILLASQLIGRSDNIEAEELLSGGLRLTPDDADLAYAYARILVERSELGVALRVLNNARPGIDSKPDYHAFIAALYQRKANHIAAIKKYSEVLRVKPDKGVWWMGLGISLQAEGQKQQALQAFQNALRDRSLAHNIRQYVSDRISVLQGATS